MALVVTALVSTRLGRNARKGDEKIGVRETATTGREEEPADPFTVRVATAVRSGTEMEAAILPLRKRNYEARGGRMPTAA
jgi:hypothetical protein